MSDLIEVCTAEELSPGERQIVEISDRISVGVFNIDGEYYGLLNSCVHQGGPLCEGKLSRNIDATVEGLGQNITERYTDEHVVACPWHGWRYDLQTGEHVGDPSISVPTFDVTIEGDTVYLCLD